MDTGEVIILQSGELELELIRRRRVMSAIRRIGLLNFKLSIAAWSIAFMLVPPAVAYDEVGHVAWLSFSLAGALVSSVGIVMSFFHTLSRASVIVELCGLLCMIVGPIVYFSIQVSLLSDGGPAVFQERFALTFFAWAMVSAVVARLATVLPRFHFRRHPLSGGSQ